jgi:hypothetical protein
MYVKFKVQFRLSWSGYGDTDEILQFEQNNLKFVETRHI